VLGSTLPVRFPECLRIDGCTLTPFAIQPGQVLTPEGCGVALRVEGSAGSWVGVWRPAARQVRHLPAPEGWLPGVGLWSRDGELQLPYATVEVPCGVARVRAEASENGTGTGTGTPDPAPPAPVAVARPVPLQQAPLARLVTKVGKPGNEVTKLVTN
jgi:hypothetical protein